jgi:hypothetical protein
MHDQTGLGPTPEPRHSQRVRNQLRAHVGLERPSHDLATEQIQDDRQIQPALVGPEIGDVCRPDLIGFRRREVTLQQVRRDRQIVIRVRRRDVLALVPCTNAMLRHQLANPLLAHAHATREQFLPHARPAIFAFDLRVNHLDVREQGIVAHAASVRFVLGAALLALMISAGADFQRFTQH